MRPRGRWDGARGRARLDRMRATALRLLAEPERPPFTAIGSWRGARDLASPHVLFVVAYVATHSLTLAIWVAAIPAALLASYRLARRQPFWQATAGLATVGLSAVLAVSTSRPQDFFLPMVVRSVAVSVGLLLTIVLRWPLVGVVLGPTLGQRLAWRKDRSHMRAYQWCTAVWAARDVVESLLKVPCYINGNLIGLGVMQALGWPLFAGTLYACWAILHRAHAFDPVPVPRSATPLARRGA